MLGRRGKVASFWTSVTTRVMGEKLCSGSLSESQSAQAMHANWRMPCERKAASMDGRSTSSSTLTLRPSSITTARSQATSEASRTPIPSPTMRWSASAIRQAGFPIQSSNVHQSRWR